MPVCIFSNQADVFFFKFTHHGVSKVFAIFGGAAGESVLAAFAVQGAEDGTVAAADDQGAGGDVVRRAVVRFFLRP